MASSKPAIAVRLPPHVFEVFARLAALQGRSRGSVVAEILESIYPPMMRTVALLEAAQEAPQQMRSGLREALERIELELVHAQGGGLAQMDWVLEEIQGAPAGDAKRSRGTRGGRPSRSSEAVQGEGSTPVPVTRGSGSKNQGVTSHRTRARKSRGKP